MQLTKQDYLTILKFYNIDINNNAKLFQIKEKAENILADKLCKCIKKLQDPNDIDETRSIAICKNSVLNKKDITASRFTCKKKARFLGKNNKRLLKKLKKPTRKQKR